MHCILRNFVSGGFSGIRLLTVMFKAGGVDNTAWLQMDGSISVVSSVAAIHRRIAAGAFLLNEAFGN